MKYKTWILPVIFLVLFVLPLAFRPMFSPDETRYAEVAREMLQSGDWITPRLNGVRYFEKPVLGYWLFAGSMRVFGENSFALRLPGVLAAALSALLLAFLMKRCGKAWPESPLLTAGIYLSMPLVFLIATIGILDGPFSLFLTGSCVFFYTALTERDAVSSGGGSARLAWLMFFVCGLFAGAAFLTKGFLAFALPGLSALAFLAWNKRWKDMFCLPWVPLAGALLVIAPWAVLIHRAEPDYWHYFVVVEHWNRFFGGEEAQHAESFFFFFPILLGGAAQWFLLVPAFAKKLWLSLRGPGADHLLQWAVCWCFVPFLLLSCSSGKLPTYILPCFAPLAVLVAVGMIEYLAGTEVPRYLLLLTRILTVCVGVALIGVIQNHLTGFPVMSLFQKDEAWKWILTLVGGTLALLALFTVSKEKTAAGKINYYLLFITPVIFCSHFVVPDYFIERRCPVVMLSNVVDRVSPDTVLVSYHYPFQDVCWMFRRADVRMLSHGEIRYGLGYPDAKARLLNDNALLSLIDERKGKGGVLVVMATDRFFEWRAKGRFARTSEWEIHGCDDGYSAVKY